TSYIKRLQETTPGLQPNPSLGPVARTVTGIVKGAISGGISLAPAIAAEAVPFAGPFLGPVVAGMEAGLETKDVAAERIKAQKPGISDAEASSIANKEALVSGSLTAATLGTLKFAKPAMEGAAGFLRRAEPSARAVQAGAAEYLPGIRMKPTYGEYAKDIGLTGGAFGLQGAVSAGTEAEIEKRHGIGTKGFFEAAKEAAPEAIGTGLVFGLMDANQIRRRINNINSIPPAVRTPEQSANLQGLLLEHERRLALPSPERGGELPPPRGGDNFRFYDVPPHDTFSPELTEELQKQGLLLPSGQGFILRGNAEDVLARYSPEFADELQNGLKRLPAGQGFELPEGDAKKLHDFNERIRGAQDDRDNLQRQLDLVTDEKRRGNLTQRLRTSESRIDALTKRRDALKPQGEPSAETIRGHQGEPNQPGIQPEGGEDIGGKDIHIAGEQEEGAQPKGGEAAPGLKPEEKWPRGEDIPPRKEEFTLEDSLPRDIRINKKDSPETTKTKLEQAKAKVEETLKNYIDDYHDLLDRKDEAVSEYDKSMGYGWEVGANLRQNHISFAKSQLEAINKALGELEPAKAAAITLDHLTKLHDEIPKMDEAAKAETRKRLEDEAARHEEEGRRIEQNCLKSDRGRP
ncbi:MAG: hypothetical protein ABSH17_06355, partial [Syntrophobacteraceae bacterium]